jgi:hypothetical protein
MTEPSDTDQPTETDDLREAVQDDTNSADGLLPQRSSPMRSPARIAARAARRTGLARP